MNKKSKSLSYVAVGVGSVWLMMTLYMSMHNPIFRQEVLSSTACLTLCASIFTLLMLIIKMTNDSFEWTQKHLISIEEEILKKDTENTQENNLEENSACDIQKELMFTLENYKK